MARPSSAAFSPTRATSLGVRRVAFDLFDHSELVEQELNVDLAALQGMASAMAPRHAGTEKMTAAVRRLLAGPAFRQQARRVQQLYAGSDGASRPAAA